MLFPIQERHRYGSPERFRDSAIGRIPVFHCPATVFQDTVNGSRPNRTSKYLARRQEDEADRHVYTPCDRQRQGTETFGRR